MGKAAFTDFIDPPLWDRAIWRGVGFVGFPDEPPILGLFFLNHKAGYEIFSSWRKKLGKVDELNQIRVSLIEGAIPGAAPGYTIRIGTSVNELERRLEQSGQSVISPSRSHRMNPPPKSENLALFKRLFAKFQTYRLAQVRPDPEAPSGLDVSKKNIIQKTAVHFRLVEEISQGDIDRDALQAGRV